MNAPHTAARTVATTVARVPIVLLVPLVVAGAVAVGIGALVTKLGPQRDGTPAPPGTPQLGSRLPVSLWPSDGSEGHVSSGPTGWRAMAERLYHRDTRIDDAARARAIVIADCSRRQIDARREIALEAHVLRSAYVPELVAAAWLYPAAHQLAAYSAFGIGNATIDILRARAALATDPDLSRVWRRELGLDVVHPEVTAAIIRDTLDEQRPRLWAVLLELAELRAHARQPLRHGA